MMRLKASQIARALNARLIGEDVIVDGVFTDSRAEQQGGLFVALKGPNFDAHDYLDKALAQGAKALLVDTQSSLPVCQIIVKDTRLALGQLAAFNRQQASAKIFAVTGSSGKTTVKEMLASILQRAGTTLATEGNLNNDIGAPLTLLRLNAEHQFAVVELGANHAGEIDYTAALTKPEIALVNNVAAAHLEGFGSLQGVANAKGEIYRHISEQGTAVINNDDEYADFWKAAIAHKVLTYSVQGKADVTATNVRLDENQCASFDLNFSENIQTISLPLAGRHNVNNALAAASCALAAGISLNDIALGLAETPRVAGRLVSHELANGCKVIDDTYNANLDSMKAAIKHLQGFTGTRIMVIGDMGELGDYAQECHQQVGQFTAESGIEKLYTCGLLSQVSQQAYADSKSNSGTGSDPGSTTSQHFTNQKLLIKQLQQEASANTTILCKGSRSARMEKIVEALLENSEQIASKIASSRGEN